MVLWWWMRMKEIQIYGKNGIHTSIQTHSECPFWGDVGWIFSEGSWSNEEESESESECEKERFYSWKHIHAHINIIDRLNEVNSKEVWLAPFICLNISFYVFIAVVFSLAHFLVNFTRYGVFSHNHNHKNDMYAIWLFITCELVCIGIDSVDACSFCNWRYRMRGSSSCMAFVK